MPIPTARLGLSKPLGNETVSRAAFSAVLDEIDAAAAGLAVPNEFRAHQGIGARGMADSGTTGFDSYDDYLQGSVWDGSASASRYRRFTRRVRATPSESYLEVAYQAEGQSEQVVLELTPSGIRLPNTRFIQARDSGGTTRNIIGVDASNVLLIGDGALTSVRIDNTLSVDSGTLYVDAINNCVGINTTVPAHALDVNGVVHSHAVIAEYAVTTNRGTSAAGNIHWHLQTSSKTRWGFILVGNETGGNSGSDLVLARYGDDGSFLGTVLRYRRDTGHVIMNTDTQFISKVGFYGANPVSKPTVTGSRGGNTALASLLAALASLGLITDSTSS